MSQTNLRINNIIVIFLSLFFVLGVNKKVFADSQDDDYLNEYDDFYLSKDYDDINSKANHKYTFIAEKGRAFIREILNEFTEEKKAELVLIGNKDSGALYIGNDYIGITFPSWLGIKYPATISYGYYVDSIKVNYIFDKEPIVTKPFLENWSFSKDSKMMFLKKNSISFLKQKLLTHKIFKIKIDFKNSDSMVAIFKLESLQKLYNSFIQSKQKTLEDFVNFKKEERLALERKREEERRLALEREKEERLALERKREEERRLALEREKEEKLAFKRKKEEEKLALGLQVPHPIAMELSFYNFIVNFGVAPINFNRPSGYLRSFDILFLSIDCLFYLDSLFKDQILNPKFLAIGFGFYSLGSIWSIHSGTLNIGLQIPLICNLITIYDVDLYLKVAPGIGFSMLEASIFNFNWNFFIGIGIRYWLL
ncbi:hypothetical protein BCD_1831 (plasmid) [Borrelia crocidurae DOU]|uniref:Uncharacterized protein n=1 Tax=Borrelia crocidurae DOU TaxID=1293575 RepID=W5SLY5_9SPIR|nr:DUF3996 domain-containing protein [Borrelia crocidurae]AHH07897.1 hypothetical protein BCD_1831 [Borrelia crocidurae DOU]